MSGDAAKRAAGAVIETRALGKVYSPGSEAEVIALLKLAHAENVPVTFRAAGTSLSGGATAVTGPSPAAGPGGR